MSTSLTERVLSFTQTELLPRVVDNILSTSVLTGRLLSQSKPWVGAQMYRPVKYKTTGQGGSFSGMGNFDTAATDTTVRMSYDLKAYEQPIVIPGLDRLLNTGAAQMTDLVKYKMEEVAQESAQNITSMLYGDGTGNSGNDFNGLENLIDDGTIASTIGGLSRATYPVLSSTVVDSGGTISLDKIGTMISTISAGTVGAQRPTLIITTTEIYDLLETLFAPTIQGNYDALTYVKVTNTSKAPIKSAEFSGGMGFEGLMYRGIPIVRDPSCTQGTMYFVNENYIEFRAKSDPSMKQIGIKNVALDSAVTPESTRNIGFNFSGMLKPTNSYGEVGHLYLFGELMTWQPRRHGKITGITSV